MKRKHSSLEIILGVVLLLVAVVFGWQLWRDKENLIGEQYYLLKASLDNASGLDVGSGVKLAGIKVGQVKSKGLDKSTYRAQLLLEINKGVKVPKDSQLVVGAAGLLGAPEVKIEAGNSSELMVAGDSFSKTVSQPSLEDMIGRAIFVLNAVGGGAKPATSSNQTTTPNVVAPEQTPMTNGVKNKGENKGEKK
ncbi:MAG: MlaD family protein [Alphaproteobacteria bacterium]|nr:MlaD family protein [Alphaproteobacteria bacterium]